MRKIIDKVKKIYHSHDIDFYFSLAGPLAMGTIHLISLLMHFDWITLNYCLFSYVSMLFKVFQWAIEKYQMRFNSYLIAIITLFILLWPMTASFVLTIKYGDNPTYIFDWMAIAYALYGTVKLIVVIRSRAIAKRITESDRKYILSWMGLISAFYTIMMMQFKLIMYSSSGEIDKSMHLMMLFTQGAIFLFALFVICLFIWKYIKNRKLTIA